MKTNFSFRFVALLLTATAMMLTSCEEPEIYPESKSAEFESLTYGTHTINGTLYLVSVDDNEYSAFSFGEKNVPGTVTADAVVLQPDHQYEGVVLLTGMEGESSQLIAAYSMTGNLMLDIMENDEALKHFQGQITNWKTGGESTGIVKLTVLNWKFGKVIIDVPVHITPEFD
jgi:hypothetical protein